MTTLFKHPIQWERCGLLVRPNGAWWMRTHAMIPTPEIVDNGLVRLYFSGRNAANQSHIGRVTVDISKERPRLVGEYEGPVLTPGALGCFDDNGVTPSCVVRDGEETRLYYIGWNPGSTVRMHLFGGLAISTDGGVTFRRWSRAPILERTDQDPFLNTAPWVVKTGSRWYLYYVAGVGWEHKDLPRYNIKMAYSDDGKHWQRTGHVCIDFAHSEENALARPFVIRDGGVWKMWFAHKGEAYRIGYAESTDGIAWHRNDAVAGFKASTDAFDSRMVEYAAVLPYEGRYVMFYNGNEYGRDGIGVAIGSKTTTP